jgi:cyclohexyl-isocyanide hydratase
MGVHRSSEVRRGSETCIDFFVAGVARIRAYVESLIRRRNIKSRVVIDGNYISTAGVTAGLDGSFKVASILRSDAVAEEIQLEIEYAPEPPFHNGTPETASPEVIRAFFENYGSLKKSREDKACRLATKLGVTLK